jgi:hypothetical protein
MGRAARANRHTERRRCGECGQERPAGEFRRIKDCPDAPDAEVCRQCEALWIEEGFLHRGRTSAGPLTACR